MHSPGPNGRRDDPDPARRDPASAAAQPPATTSENAAGVAAPSASGEARRPGTEKPAGKPPGKQTLAGKLVQMTSAGLSRPFIERPVMTMLLTMTVIRVRHPRLPAAAR